jgi:transposase
MDFSVSYDSLTRHQLIELSQSQQSQIQDQQFKIDTLTHELAKLKKLVFGSRSERFIAANPDSPVQQGVLDLDVDVLADRTAVSHQVSYTRTQVTTKAHIHAGRNPLPEHLHREVIVIEPKEDITGAVKIGQEVSEVLEIQEQKLFVKHYIRPKYLLKTPEQTLFLIAAPPAQPIAKCIAGPGLLAQVVIDKYADHLPLYRQMQRFERVGMSLPYATITDWIKQVCELIAPLYEAHKRQLLATHYLHADETGIKVLDKEKKGASHKGFFWVYHNSLEKIVLFDYQPGRGGEHPTGMLKDFSGYLQADGYGVYDHLDGQHGITLMNCLAHGRREFDEAKNNDKARAEYALGQIQQLYAIERDCTEKKLNFDQIKEERQLKAAPILEHMKGWLMDSYSQVLPKSTIGKAIAYNLKRWDRLSIYITDGRLKIDNNPVENAIRGAVIGRKNYLFAGSHEAASRTAMLYSLVGTCKMHGINPFDWLKDLLIRISDHHINRIEELLPQNSSLKLTPRESSP